MEDFLVFLAEALRRAGESLDAASPLPWPLLVAVLLPFYALALSVSVWWMRGSGWPVACDYPTTTTGHPCRNVVVGEWRRCHVHRRRRRRRTDQHLIRADLRRWQTVTRSGRVLDRNDQIGRGLVRMEGRASTLFFRRGFARKPVDVVRFLPIWFQETRERWREVRRRFHRLREAPNRWRIILWPASPTIGGVSDRLPIVIRATRVSIYSTAAGLILVVVAVLLPGGTAQFFDYIAALCFVTTWAVLKEGVWQAEHRWANLAFRRSWNWAWPFLLFSVIGGTLVNMGQS